MKGWRGKWQTSRGMNESVLKKGPLYEKTEWASGSINENKSQVNKCAGCCINEWTRKQTKVLFSSTFLPDCLMSQTDCPPSFKPLTVFIEMSLDKVPMIIPLSRLSCFVVLQGKCWKVLLQDQYLLVVRRALCLCRCQFVSSCYLCNFKQTCGLM